jgi:DNA-binding transcriptional MocR family regulator
LSVQHIAWALAQPTGSPTRKCVLVALANRVNPDTELCCPSISRLVFETELSRSSVKRALYELDAVGLIVKVPRVRANGSDTSNEYRFPHVTVNRGEVQSEPPPMFTVDPPEPKELTERETSIAAEPRKRAPNLVWDALSHVFGEPTTRSAQQMRGKVVSSLRAAGATPDEIVARAKRWPAHFDGAVMTDRALEKHWDTLGRKPLRRTG